MGRHGGGVYAAMEARRAQQSRRLELVEMAEEEDEEQGAAAAVFGELDGWGSSPPAEAPLPAQHQRPQSVRGEQHRAALEAERERAELAARELADEADSEHRPPTPTPPPRTLRERVEQLAAELHGSETAVREQGAIMTQLQRSYQQQRLDLRAQLGLAPDEDDSADVRHAKRVDELQRQIATVEAAIGSAAPDLERAEAEVTAAEQAAAALQADRAATEAAIEQAGVDAADLRARLPRLRQRAGQREACLRQQHQKLAEIDAAIDAQAEREKQAAARQSAPAEAAGAYLARAPHPPALAAPPTAVLMRGLLPAMLCAASLLAMLEGRLAAVEETLREREREAGALQRTVAREKDERAALTERLAN